MWELGLSLRGVMSDLLHLMLFLHLQIGPDHLGPSHLVVHLPLLDRLG